jgi:integrase
MSAAATTLAPTPREGGETCPETVATLAPKPKRAAGSNGQTTARKAKKDAPKGNRRSYGTGSLEKRKDARGRESWYGRWYTTDGRHPNRKLGLVRQKGSSEGLTIRQAEKRLRQLIEDDETTAAPVTSEVTIARAGQRMLHHLKVEEEIKPTTLDSYGSIFRTHIEPRPLGDLPIRKANAGTVRRLKAQMRRNGKAPKTIQNAYRLLNQIFEFAKQKEWCQANPCEEVKSPRVERQTELRFLNQEELADLLRSVDIDGLFGATDRLLFLTAALTGMRQGELLALRWKDVDWQAERIRVRRNYVRGHWVTPKSRRMRSVPLAPVVAEELEIHRQRSNYDSGDDLVFAHPETGDVLDHCQLVRRFKKALKAAGLPPLRFHDLRHTFGTQMAANGTPPLKLKEWFGHGSVKTTEIYEHYAPLPGEGQEVQSAFANMRGALAAA